MGQLFELVSEVGTSFNLEQGKKKECWGPGWGRELLGSGSGENDYKQALYFVFLRCC